MTPEQAAGLRAIVDANMADWIERYGQPSFDAHRDQLILEWIGQALALYGEELLAEFEPTAEKQSVLDGQAVDADDWAAGETEEPDPEPDEVPPA